MVGDVQLHHAAPQLCQPGRLRRTIIPLRRASCRRPACPCGPRSPPGTGGRSRTPRGCRSRTAWAPGRLQRRRAHHRRALRHPDPRPSMVSVTVSASTRIGVPVSSSCNRPWELSYSAASRACGAAKSSRKCSSALSTGNRRQSAERAQRTVGQHLAEIAQQRHVFRPVAAGDDLVDHLDAARRADAAGRALAAGLSLAQNSMAKRACAAMSTRVVEHDDAAVAEHSFGGEHRLVVERRVEQRFREIGAQRAADLHRADRAARRVPPPKSSTSSRIVAPKAISTRPPCLTLPASWNGCVPRERPMP